MNLLFDLSSTQPLPGAKFHGGGKYGLAVFLELVKVKREGFKLFALFDSNRSLDPLLTELCTSNNIQLVDVRKESIPLLVQNLRIDRFYSALPYNIEDIEKIPCDVYGTIHGFRELELVRDIYSLRYFSTFREAIKYSLKAILSRYYFNRKLTEFKHMVKSMNVIVVSNHTRYALDSFLPDVPYKDVQVYYSPDVSFVPSDDNITKSSEKYFLIVSSNVWYKNSIRAMEALDELFSMYSDLDYKVVMTGVNDIPFFEKKVVNKDKFRFVSYVSEEELYLLYRDAFSLLYLSLNEGFGYPPLEAMKHGTPVIASPFTSISEICGDAVLYCNPYSIKEIQNRVLSLFNSDSYDSIVVKSREKYNLIKQKQDKDMNDMIEYLTTYQTL